ncbi:hypothetical protein ACWD7F_39020 [Streptomyces sp. NPDC005122]
MAGTGCSNASTSFHHHGWYADGIKGWRTISTGGYSGSGCNGDYVAVPMSGNLKDDKNSVVWMFSTGPVSKGTCKLSVYVPNDSNVKDVGGAPAYYTVSDGRAFTVNQVKNRGRWVSVGSYAVSGGEINVTMHTRGEDWVGSTKTYAHLAASAIKASCTG